MLPGSSAEIIHDEDSFDSENNIFIENQNPQQFTNIRQMLEMIETYDGAASDGEETEDGEKTEGIKETSNREFQNLYTQFEDVMTHHEKRLEKLRQALSS